MTYHPLAQEMYSLQGCSALVTGATGHLGRAMCGALAGAGAHVLVNGRDAIRVSALVDALRDSGGSAEAWVFDVTDANAVEETFAKYASRPLHVLVNNAYLGGAGSLEAADSQAYRDSYEVALVSAAALVRTALSALRAAVSVSGDASVINVASMYGKVSPDLRIYENRASANPPFYGAAKAALLQWSRYAACELGAEGIRVNSLSPGPFPSPETRASNAEFVDGLARRVPLGRVGEANEICGPLLFLASRASSYVNGADLAVDGGWTAW